MWTFELHSLSIARISLWEPQPKTLWPQPRGCVIFSLFYSPLYGSNSQAISTPRSIENGLVTAAIDRNDLLTDQSISWQPRYLMSRGQMTTNEGVRGESPDSMEIFLSGAKKLANQYEWKVFRSPDLPQSYQYHAIEWPKPECDFTWQKSAMRC